MKILVSAMPAGGSTFTFVAIHKYLKYDKFINEPCATIDFWKHINQLMSYEEYFFQNRFKTTQAFEKYITMSDVVIKVNYYTRILHLLDLPEEVKVIFVLRNPVDFAASTIKRKFLPDIKNPHVMYLQRVKFRIDGQDNINNFLMDTWIDIANYMIDYAKINNCLILKYHEYVSNPEILKKQLDKYLGTDNVMHDYVKNDLPEYEHNDYRENEIKELWDKISK